MSKKLLILFLAGCSLLTAQAVVDGAGVTVGMNGAAVLHRPSINYPSEALQAGVQGNVLVQLKLDSTGVVSDAQVLGGPDELRKTVLQSVLQWHFMREFASTTRTIQVMFEVPKPGQFTLSSPLSGGLFGPRLMPAPVPDGLSTSRIRKVSVVGLPERAVVELLASFPVREGDEWSMENLARAAKAARAYDEHLSVQMMSGPVSATGERELTLVISAPYSPAEPGRIKVGGNVQGAMTLKKVAPEYPAAAKAAGISGVVHLSATIARDGTIAALTVLGGPTELAPAAVDAVKQWVYRPTMLNGSPVEVETTIDVNFTLNQ